MLPLYPKIHNILYTIYSIYTPHAVAASTLQDEMTTTSKKWRLRQENACGKAVSVAWLLSRVGNPSGSSTQTCT